MDPTLFALLISLAGKAVEAGLATPDEEAAHRQAKDEANASVEAGVKVADEALRKTKGA